MSNKRVEFDEEAKQIKEKNSLDSDDEEKMEDDALDDDDIEGQEEPTIDHDGEIQITPFNMKDEMEEGHFNKEGMFVFDNNKGRIKDNWIDNVDWMKISEKKLKETQVNDATEELSDADYIQVYTSILEFVESGETVLKAVRRLGGNKSTQSASQRWGKKKKQAAAAEDDGDQKRNRENMLRLTELADKLIQDGNMDIYEATREKIAFSLKKLQEPQKTALSITDDDAALDMFADSLDEERGVKRKLDDDQEKSEAQHTSNGVLWLYKLENSDSAETNGPVTSSQMMEWCEGDYFSKGAFCRKVNTEGPFYDVKRIDFELYT